ncbi:MAG: Rhs family protein [Acidimicrobiaceae bacterium]|nr:Rhs family protein [Acidimicrobiaceae bacterium]
MLLRARVLVCCVVVLVLAGAVSASADSWSVEGGTHILKGGSGEVIKSWTAKEWQVWRKEVQSVGECMGVAEGCAAGEDGAETPVEDVSRVGAEDAEKGVGHARAERSLTGEVQSVLDLAGKHAGTLPSDLGKSAIAEARLQPASHVVGVELGNGLDQLFELPEWHPLSRLEQEAVEEYHGESHEEVSYYPANGKGKIEECFYFKETSECENRKVVYEYPLGIYYIEWSATGGSNSFGFTSEVEGCTSGTIQHECVGLHKEEESHTEGPDIPIGWERKEFTVEEGYYEGKLFRRRAAYVTHAGAECGTPPAGFECKPVGMPAPGLLTPEMEEENGKVGLPSKPKESSPVNLPTDPPSSLNESDLKELSESAAGRGGVEGMFPERTREERELEEKERAQFGGENGGEPGRRRCSSGKPVNCATGNQFESQTDLAVGGRGPALELALTYNSQLALKETGAGTFGFGWTGSYSAHLELKGEGEEATVYQDNGSAVMFSRSGEAWTAPAGLVQATLADEGSGYVYTLPDQTALHFNSSGWLTSEADRNGNTLTVSHSSEGRLEAIKDGAGREITLKYDSEGQVESASDPMGHTAKYTYEGGNLASVTLPGETTPRWKFRYNSSHELTSETDGRGYASTSEYDAAGQVISETDPLHRTRKWSYTSTFSGTETTITEPNGASTVEQFNEMGSPTSVTRAAGTSLAATTTDRYDSADELLASTNPDKHTTEYGYDAAGNRTSEKNADGDETKWEYDSTHDVTGITTPMGEKTTIKRNSQGSAEAIERPAPGSTTQKTSYKYDSAGDVESMTNPLEHTWKYEYDSYGDRKSETDPEGNKRTWEYNEDSQETATVSPRGNATGAEASKFTTKNERDAQGRVLKITDPLGHTTKYTYDADGNLETITDGNSHKTTYSYDEGDEPIKVKEANGDLSETEYDAAGEVIARIDGNKHKWKYVRNELEQVTEVIDPLGHKTINEYDLVGNLTKLTDPAKRTTSYKYDPANRLSEVSYSDGKTPTVKYEYNKDGDRTTMSDGTGTTTNTYDQLDRVTERENGHKAIVKYEYDLANDQTKITYPNGKAITRAFDKDSRLEKITDWSSNITKFTYNADSQPATTVFPTASKDEDIYAYNDADQMTETKMKKGSETLASLVYTRDNDGQLKKTTSKSLPGTEVTENTYDEDNRLTKAGSTEYKYDPANNPTTTGSSTNTYNEADQLTKGTTASYSYDELGERTKTTPTTGPATSYGYDQAGNLLTVERPKEGTTPKIEDSYAYNGEGLRTSETISGTTTYLGWQTAGVELPSILTNETNSFIYGPGSMPIEQINNSTGTVTYLHHDQAGSTRLLTGSTGTVTGKCTYSAYGTPTCEGTATTPLGYDGQYTSSDTGLVYLRNRVYDPATAQFLTRDPLDEGSSTLAHATGEQYVAAALRAASGSGPYVYANDNPLNNYDPTGLFTVGICVHGEVNFILHIGASGCVQGSSSGEVGGTVAGSVGLAQGAGVGATVGPQVSNAEHISELSGPFANAGGQLGVGPDVSLEAFGAPGQCGPIVGGGVSAGAGLGVSRWIGGSYTGAWSVNF